MPDAEVQKFWERHQQWSKLADRLERKVRRARVAALILSVSGAVLQTLAGIRRWHDIVGKDNFNGQCDPRHPVVCQLSIEAERVETGAPPWRSVASRRCPTRAAPELGHQSAAPAPTAAAVGHESAALAPTTTARWITQAPRSGSAPKRR